jgi:hypothetical protein
MLTDNSIYPHLNSLTPVLDPTGLYQFVKNGFVYLPVHFNQIITGSEIQAQIAGSLRRVFQNSELPGIPTY